MSDVGRTGYSAGTVKELHMSDAEQQRYSVLLDDIDRAFEARREVELWNIQHQLKEALAEARASA